MSETKWTPEPWRAGLGDAYLPKTLIGESSVEIACIPHETYDAIDVFGKRRGGTEEEHLANAHLIAAAPDLYAALDSLLKTFVDDLGECGYDEDDIADHDGVKRATAALRKARGET